MGLGTKLVQPVLLTAELSLQPQTRLRGSSGNDNPAVSITTVCLDRQVFIPKPSFLAAPSSAAEGPAEAGVSIGAWYSDLGAHNSFASAPNLLPKHILRTSFWVVPSRGWREARLMVLVLLKKSDNLGSVLGTQRLPGSC